MDGRQMWLAVLAIFLLAGIASGIAAATHVVHGFGAGVVLFLALLCIVVAAMTLGGVSTRAPGRALFGAAAGIVGVGLLGWTVFSPTLALGLRLGASVGLLALIPRAWRAVTPRSRVPAGGSEDRGYTGS